MSIDFRKVRNYALMLTCCWVLVRVLIWLSWGLWVVTR